MGAPKVDTVASHDGQFVHVTVGPGQGVAIREVDEHGNTVLEHLVGPACREWAARNGIEVDV